MTALGARVNRRQFLRIVAGVGAGALVAKGGWDVLATEPGVVRDSRLLMGTVVNLIVTHDDVNLAQSALRESWTRMTRLERLLSRFDERSEVSRLNAAGRLEKPSEPVLALLQQSRELSERSCGAFDVTVKPLIDLYQRQAAKGALPQGHEVREILPLVDYRRVLCSKGGVRFTRSGMQLTFDAIAKGYIVDAGVAALRKCGIDNVLLEAGGDLMAAGEKAGAPWRVGVESPRPAGRGFVTTCGLDDCAMATSGDYMQSFTEDHSEYHIIDPRVGRSPRGLASASVTAPTAALADALSTACMVLGEKEGMSLVAALPRCEALFVTKGMRSVRSSGFPAQA